MKHLVLFFILLFGIQFADGQSQMVSVSFNPIFKGADLDLTKENLEHGDMEIEVLRLYISNVHLKANGKYVYSEENSFHLMDFSEEKTPTFKLKKTNRLAFDEITFSVGIDSTTNTSGAMGNDLDPTKGMYWTWQSGYINFKLEGTAKDCPARKNKFQFHLGGYAHPYATIQEVTLPIADRNEINIEIDLDKFMADINLTETYQVMRPSEIAVNLSEKLPTLFSIED